MHGDLIAAQNPNVCGSGAIMAAIRKMCDGRAVNARMCDFRRRKAGNVPFCLSVVKSYKDVQILVSEALRAAFAELGLSSPGAECVCGLVYMLGESLAGALLSDDFEWTAANDKLSKSLRQGPYLRKKWGTKILPRASQHEIYACWISGPGSCAVRARANTANRSMSRPQPGL